MNYLFHYLKAESCQQAKMMIFAASAQMVEIFSFVISVLGPSTKVFTLTVTNIFVLPLILDHTCLKRSSM